jgi:hypothetical protein
MLFKTISLTFPNRMLIVLLYAGIAATPASAISPEANAYSSMSEPWQSFQIFRL